MTMKPPRIPAIPGHPHLNLASSYHARPFHSSRAAGVCPAVSGLSPRHPTPISRAIPASTHLFPRDFRTFSVSSLQSAAQGPSDVVPPPRIRNIGIIAHIDAGKTTTTERMLYYAGFTAKIGDVDSGTTVTDFLPEERQRGITIQSACIPLAWTPTTSPTCSPQLHLINLIDTPGHADFTVEVERSLSVLDSCVVLLDAVAGVEAQTRQVWTQANRYSLPRLVVVNKMDRTGADFAGCVREVAEKLAVGGKECAEEESWGYPVPIQIPAMDDSLAGTPGNGFMGIIDVITMEFLTWPATDITGSNVVRTPLSPTLHPMYYPAAVEARSHLVDTLTSHDDTLVEAFLSPTVDGDPSLITPRDLAASIRRTTIAGKIVPVMCAASLRNTGVQPVLDAVTEYLPGADERAGLRQGGGSVAPKNKPADDGAVVALAFKVVHDVRRGYMTYVRVYKGTLDAKQSLYNHTLHSANPSAKVTPERASRLLQPYAGDFEEMPSLRPGHVAALTGLKSARTGDVLSTASPGKTKLDLTTLPPRIHIPPAVYFVSVDPGSTVEEKKLNEAMEIVMREDPSVTFRVDEDTGGQCVIGGMGELHLEVVGKRLKERFGVQCEVGKVRIGYREVVDLEEGEKREGRCEMDRVVFGKKQTVDVVVEVGYVEEGTVGGDGAAYTPTTTDKPDATKSPKSAKPGKPTTAPPKSPPPPYHTHNPLSDSNLIILPLDPARLFIPPASSTSSDPSQFPTIPPPNYPPLADLITSILSGARTSFFRGPSASSPIRQCTVSIKSVTLYAPDISTPSAIRVAVSRAVTEALTAAGTKVAEPVANVVITIPTSAVGAVSRDLTGLRGGRITEVRDAGAGGGRSVVEAVVPVGEMGGYSGALRSLTGGEGGFGAVVKGYEVVGEGRREKVAAEARGH